MTGTHDRTSPAMLPVVVVGAGPAGLACAAALARRDVPTVVLEQGDGVGAAWRSRYDALRLNSGRRFSGLPGLPIPRSAGTFPRRDDVVAYLEDYRAAAGLDVRTGVRVQRVQADAGRWRVVTDTGDWITGEVVVATGRLACGTVPPQWSTGRTSIRCLHSAEYRGPATFSGADVLVAGAGSSGFEIAHDLTRGGARRVLLAVRTPPNLLPRAVLGQPGDPVVAVLRRLPPAVADAVLRPLRRLTIGDLTAQGLPVPDEGPFSRMRRAGDAGPAIIDPGVVEDLRNGRIEVVPAVRELLEDRVRLADGRTERVDAVVAATGLRPALEPLVGELGVLDESGLPLAHDGHAARPGLRFLNFGMRPGLLAAAGQRARRTAAAIAREYRERDEEEPRTRRRRAPRPDQRAQSMQVRAVGRAASRSSPIGRPQVSQRP